MRCGLREQRATRDVLCTTARGEVPKPASTRKEGRTCFPGTFVFWDNLVSFVASRVEPTYFLDRGTRAPLDRSSSERRSRAKGSFSSRSTVPDARSTATLASLIHRSTSLMILEMVACELVLIEWSRMVALTTRLYSSSTGARGRMKMGCFGAVEGLMVGIQ